MLFLLSSFANMVLFLQHSCYALIAIHMQNMFAHSFSFMLGLFDLFMNDSLYGKNTSYLITLYTSFELIRFYPTSVFAVQIFLILSNQWSSAVLVVIRNVKHLLLILIFLVVISSATTMWKLKSRHTNSLVPIETLKKGFMHTLITAVAENNVDNLNAGEISYIYTGDFHYFCFLIAVYIPFLCSTVLKKEQSYHSSFQDWENWF